VTQSQSNNETQTMSQFPQIAKAREKGTRKTISVGVKVIINWQDKKHLIKQLCRLNTRLMMVYTRALNYYIRYSIEHDTIVDTFQYITDAEWHNKAMTQLLYTIVTPNRRDKRKQTQKNESVDTFIHFYQQHFPQRKAKEFVTETEPNKKLKSALRQALKYTANTYNANCQVHLTNTFAAYLRRLVRTYKDKDKKLETAFVQAFIEDEEEEDAEEEQHETQDNPQDNRSNNSDMKQQKQKLQEKLQEMQQLVKDIIPERYHQVLDGWPRTQTQMKRNPTDTLLIMYNINYYLETQEAKRFNLLPTTSFRTNHITIDGKTMNLLSGKKFADKTPLENHLDLKKIRFHESGKDESEEGITQYVPITITTDSASVNVTLTKKSVHEKRETAKEKAREEGNKGRQTSKKGQKRTKPSKDKTKWQKHRESVRDALKRKRNDNSNERSKSRKKKKQKTIQSKQSGTIGSSCSGSSNSSGLSGGTSNDNDEEYRNHEELFAQMARRDGFIVKVPPRPHTPHDQWNMSSCPWSGFTRLAYLEHDQKQQQQQQLDDIAIAGLDPGIKNIAAISYGPGTKSLTLSQHEYYHKINRNKNQIINTRFKRRHGIEEREATIKPAVVASSIDYRQHIDSLLDVGQDLEAFYSNQRILRCKFDQKKRRDSVLQRMASHVYEALAHGESQDSTAAHTHNTKQRHQIRRRQRMHQNYSNANVNNQETSHTTTSTNQGNPPQQRQQQQQGGQGNKKSRKRKKKRKKKRKVWRKKPKNKKSQSIDPSLVLPHSSTRKRSSNKTNQVPSAQQDTIRQNKGHTSHTTIETNEHDAAHKTTTTRTKTRFHILFYGNATFKHVYRGNTSVPNKRLLLELVRRMLVVGTDEYYTSQVCHACLQRSIPKNSHDVVHCKNPQCHVTHSRDINSAKNIYLIGRHYLLSGRRHSSFCPLKDAASNNST
jgi:transposase